MKDKDKRKDNETGSEAHYQPFRLHFLQGNKQAHFHTNTFNQISSFFQDFKGRFDGVYKRFGNNIKLSSTLVLKIQKRKHGTRNKPEEYLSLYIIRNGRPQYVCYISSLFKIKENIYWFDYEFEGRKIYYIMELLPNLVKIKGSESNHFLPLYTNRGKK